MTDDDFLLALESCSLASVDFNHMAHLRAGYLYLCRHADFVESLSAMRRAIKGFAASIGKDQHYHETITVAFMTLINERRSEQPAASWQDFAALHADFFKGNPLAALYSQERLMSPRARQIFLLPDLPSQKQAA